MCSFRTVRLPWRQRRKKWTELWEEVEQRDLTVSLGNGIDGAPKRPRGLAQPRTGALPALAATTGAAIRFYHLGAGCQYHSVIFVQGSDGGRVACIERSSILIIELLNCGTVLSRGTYRYRKTDRDRKKMAAHRIVLPEN